MMKKVMIIAIAAIFGASAAYANPEPAAKVAVEKTAITSTSNASETQPAPAVADFHKTHNTRNANILNRTSAKSGASYSEKITKAHADAHRLALSRQKQLNK